MEEEKENKNSEKLKALRAAMDKIEKTYGKGSIMKMGDEKVEEIPVISSGSLGLNVALGVGGYPRDVSLRSTAPSRRVKPRSPFMPLRKHRKPEALLHLLMQSMLLTVFMPTSWVSTPTSC